MANDKNDKKVKKEKKRFAKDFKTELKKVTWPTGKQLVNNTIAVVTIVIITAAIVFVLDLGFELLNKYGINGLKNVLSNQNDNAVVQEENTPAPEATPANDENNSDTVEGQGENQTDATPSPEAE